ncbi:hypothetical protein PMAYCL1PPCAC_04758, partial [Pristionchus mayeri]
IRDIKFPEVELNAVPPDNVVVQVPCKESTTAKWCLRCYNVMCKKHCEDCGLEWGTRTLRCLQFGYRPADVRHTCLLLESKSTERMKGDKNKDGVASMAFECRVCESRNHDLAHSVNLDLHNTRPDPIPEWSNDERNRRHIMY